MADKPPLYRWLVLMMLFFMLFISVVSMNCIPALFSEITQEFPLTKAQMGTVMGVLTLASLFFAPVGGMLSDTIGCRWALGGSAIVVAAAGAARYGAADAGELTLCMFFLGAGMAVLGPNIPKALGTWFPPRELARANGICFASMGVGGAVAMASAAGFLSPVCGGWRNAMLVFGFMTLCAGILWVAFYRDKKTPALEQPSKHNMFSSFGKVLRSKDMWFLSVFYGLNMVGLMAIITLLPVSLEERGISNPGMPVAAMMASTVVFNILGGIASDRFGMRKPFLVICALLLAVSIPSFTASKGIALFFFLILAGAAMGTIAPVLMAIPVELTEIGTARAGTAVGFLFMLGNTGGFIGPVAAGAIMDATGSDVMGFLFMAAALFLAAFVALPLRETGEKNNGA